LNQISNQEVIELQFKLVLNVLTTGVPVITWKLHTLMLWLLIIVFVDLTSWHVFLHSWYHGLIYNLFILCSAWLWYEWIIIFAVLGWVLLMCSSSNSNFTKFQCLRFSFRWLPLFIRYEGYIEQDSSNGCHINPNESIQTHEGTHFFW
jgi:hypothetical protein